MKTLRISDAIPAVRPKIISHRGNIQGSYKANENHPDYLKAAINAGFGVEMDVWFVNGEWALGHDKPAYAVTFDFLLKFNESRPDSAWLHMKNLEAIQELKAINYYSTVGMKDPFEDRCFASTMNFFWHQDDDMTITSHGHIWVHPKVKTIPMRSAWVVPDEPIYDWNNPNWSRAAYVCVDNPVLVRDFFTSCNI